MSRSNPSQQHGRHNAWLKENELKTIENSHERETLGNSKHHISHFQYPLPGGHTATKHASPGEQSISDKSSPPDVFSPASSTVSSATSVSGRSSPPATSASWAGSTSGAPGADTFATQNLASSFQHNATTAQPTSHPRRTAVSSSWTVPTLLRQEQRRQHLVEQLVDSATELVAQVWPKANAITTFPNKVISLRFYIRETLRRSRTSYSTLQVTLWYMLLIRPFVVAARSTSGSSTRGEDQQSHQDDEMKPEGPSCALQCGRRMFLTALILASKYLQDRNFTARAWSKITGLPSKEIVTNEFIFLAKIEWDLHMKEQDFKYWNAIILRSTDSLRVGGSPRETWSRVLNWFQEGAGLKSIAERLFIQQQKQGIKPEVATCNPLSTLLTPSSSFNSSLDMSLVADTTPPTSVGSKASPAISVASDTSGSSLSFTEVKAPVARFDDPITRISSKAGVAGASTLQLLTPSSSFSSERCDNDGPITYPSQASWPLNQVCEDKVTDLGSLVNSLDNQPLVSSSQYSTDFQPGMRASAQQPVPNPVCQTWNSAHPMNDTICGLPQRSIAHESIQQPTPTCGKKRSASSQSTALNTSETKRETKTRSKRTRKQSRF